MNRLWQGILALKSAVEQDQSSLEFCYLNYRNGRLLVNQMPTSTDQFVRILPKGDLSTLTDKVPTLLVNDFIQLQQYHTTIIPIDLLLFLEKYILFALLPLKARREKRAIAVAHLAQTLDGKIATSTGDSKWIGNQENLIHAHRMRALCEGVLVGSNTLKEDQPKLTVRHVEGENPIRIILGNPTPQFDCLLESGATPILTLYHKTIEQHSAVQYFKFEAIAGRISTKEVLTFLFKKGIHTVYIEGGARTISCFFKNSDIDILQLHIAPIIFGSGTSSLQFPSVQFMKEAFTFKHHYFQPVGNTMMFTGFI